jgi:hypothetical protein
VWQEVFDNGDKIRPDTIIQVWKDFGTRWRPEVAKVRDHKPITVVNLTNLSSPHFF